jgi:hypothetical protein
LIAENTLNPGVQTIEECTVTVNASPQAVTIDAFSVEPEQIIAGEVATLTWQVTNPTTLDINGDRVAPAGTLLVEPLQTTTYTLTANGHEGPGTAEVTLTVGALEEIETPLLEDRGGCTCGATRGSSILLLALVLAGGFLRRRV